MPAFMVSCQSRGPGREIAVKRGIDEIPGLFGGGVFFLDTLGGTESMEELVEKSMRGGAMGLSTGLIYVPGTYAKTDEIAPKM